jgi:Xaa-Pro aminopeptidase
MARSAILASEAKLFFKRRATLAWWPPFFFCLGRRFCLELFLMSKTARLLYGASKADANLLYVSKVFVPDAFLILETEDGWLGLLSPLEIGRVRRDSALDRVESLDEWSRRAKDRYGEESGTSMGRVARLLAEDSRLDGFVIPENFPAGLALEVQEAGLGLVVQPDPFFPERARKTAEEVRAIAAGCQCAACGFKRVEEILREATVKDGLIHWNGEALHAERVHEEIQIACLRAGGLAEDPIVAGGDQACDPHERGHGPIPAHRPIIVDIFPRMHAHGYWGDMTRTYVKGEPAKGVPELIETVKEAHERALGLVQSGVNSSKPYQQTREFFTEAGYVTEEVAGTPTGFFHGLGHGLGLDIHEFPGMGSRHGGTLEAGQVVTVEPGLYYPGLGGCRWEDVVLVGEASNRQLSQHPYEWRF